MFSLQLPHPKNGARWEISVWYPFGVRHSVIEFVKRSFARKGFLLSKYDMKHRKQWLNQVCAIKDERPFLLDPGEACQLIAAAEATAKLSGDMAEIGTAFGASAKLLASHAHGRTLHIFDTFEGLPSVDKVDANRFAAGQFACSKESVGAYLQGLNVKLYQGYFPSDTGAQVEQLRFSFVHLDMDLYRGTLEALEFFYPRLCPGGMVICHDFVSAEGVNQAYREFMADKPEPLLELSGYQCLLVKT